MKADDSNLKWDEPETNGGESKEWLVTFADISLLLMVFFVLLFSMSTIDVNRFTESVVSVRQALGEKESELTVKMKERELGVLLDEVQLKRQLEEAQKKVYADMQYYYTTQGMEGIVGASLEKGIITLRVPSEVLFGKQEVDLTSEGREAIKKLYEFFIQHPDQGINIRGFTDDMPPTGGRFRDNWEISAMRAVNVLRYLVELGMEPERLTATGLADLQPLVPNNSPENRAKNRRVEFVLERRIGVE